MLLKPYSVRRLYGIKGSSSEFCFPSLPCLPACHFLFLPCLFLPSCFTFLPFSFFFSFFKKYNSLLILGNFHIMYPKLTHLSVPPYPPSPPKLIKKKTSKQNPHSAPPSMMSEYMVVKSKGKRQNGSHAVVRALAKKQGASRDGLMVVCLLPGMTVTSRPGLLPTAISEPKTAGIQGNILFLFIGRIGIKIISVVLREDEKSRGYKKTLIICCWFPSYLKLSTRYRLDSEISGQSLS